MAEKNITIKVPTRFYVGMKRQGDGESKLSLGFATPYEPDTAAFEKRKSTVDLWATPSPFCKLTKLVFEIEGDIFIPEGYF